ncbi:ribonuclease H-like domain-containing protein [Patescibacteria group bacterium]
MRKLYLDIETLPAPDDKHEILRFLHEKAIEKNKKAKKDFEQYLLKTSFNGAFGRILCIGYAVDDMETEVIYEGGDETKMLEKFWKIADKSDLFIGHNVMDFDLRFIYQRSIINKVKPSRDLSFARYRKFPIYDTMREWTNWSFDASVGLEPIALALGIPTPKDGIDGSQVFDFYKAGKIDEILEYCKRDVDTTRAVYKRMIFEE